MHRFVMFKREEETVDATTGKCLTRPKKGKEEEIKGNIICRLRLPMMKGSA